MNFIIFLIITINLALADDKEDLWKGKWFPFQPVATTKRPYNNCDNAKDNLSIDFDHSNIEELFSCIEKKNLYEPNINTNPLRIHNNIPHFYHSSEVCMNETIEYDETIPTFGSYRPHWAKYGEYKYLPVQRWMHNLKNGAIVMLYHPCANKLQVDRLKELVKNCLLRYIITPSTRLSKDRPLALVAWSKSLEFSVTDNEIIKDFIKTSALQGPENNETDGEYNELLNEASQIVSDEMDSKLCPSDIVPQTM